MYIFSVTDFPLFCSNSARKCLILPAECSPQKSLILLENLPAEFIQTYRRTDNKENDLNKPTNEEIKTFSIQCLHVLRKTAWFYSKRRT